VQTVYLPNGVERLHKSVVDTTTHPRCPVCSKSLVEWTKATYCSKTCRLRAKKMRLHGQEPDGQWVNKKINPASPQNKLSAYRGEERDYKSWRPA
jgi:hypothetical protein